MPESTRELIVFPTELALRRFQQGAALEQGWVDASGHTTFARLRNLCLPYAKVKGRQMDAVQQLLMRKQVVEVAHGHFAGRGTLGELSPNALSEVLEQLITELASLPKETARIVDWLLDHHRAHKLYQLGTLFSVWRAVIQQEGLADALDVNLSILKLLSGNRQKWPPLLRDCKQLTFKSVRWFNPFEESCIAALNQKLKLRVESALPPAHAEAAADKLGQQIRSEIMAQPWAVWAEDLGDALAVDSPDVLQLADAARIDFSRSAGTYGEIEDLARRIAWHLHPIFTTETQRHGAIENLRASESSSVAGGKKANRIALVVPNLGTVQDIVPHVFSRFKIPYYFRRGRPVLSSPCVKAFFAWLAFPLRPERDALIDLVRNPAIEFEARDERIEQLLKMPLLKMPPLLDRKYVEQAFQPARSGLHALEILKERILEPDDHFNAEALTAVATALEKFGDHSMPLADLIDLLEEFLQEATVRPRDSHEQGVWILNPHDAVGLDFDLVLFAGLNEGEFPGVPKQDALLNDKERYWERYWLKTHLEEQGRRLPQMALPEAPVLFEQQSVLFLSALGMAREQLVFSYQAVDQEGNEKGEGEYYRKLWDLVGWPALSSYDQWRIQQLEGDNVFSNHWEAQEGAEEFVPMLGESFLPIVPLPLCRAEDEALQAAVQQGRRDACDTVPQASRLLPAEHIIEMLKIEAEREAFLETPVEDRAPSKYCGHIESLTEKVADWFEHKGELSPTALEALAQCRYIFLLEKVFGFRDPRLADDSPDPMDRGGLIHSILQEIYSAIAAGEAGIDAPRYWAVKGASGWIKRTEAGVDALALATFVPEFADGYEAFARRVAERRMNRAKLGHAGVWAAEQKKVLEQVLNFVRHDVETCAAENRFPALFELTFGDETAVDLGEVKLKGVIDRIDLVFAETGELKKVRVLDYKGVSRSRSKPEEYVDEIRRNLDCQLPVYAFAAQEYFFGEFNADSLNAMTEAGYLFYQRQLKDVGKTLKKSLVPMDEPELIEGFLATLFENLRRLKAGDFAVDPMVAAYNDFQSVCRTEAVSKEDME